MEAKFKLYINGEIVFETTNKNEGFEQYELLINKFTDAGYRSILESTGCDCGYRLFMDEDAMISYVVAYRKNEE